MSTSALIADVRALLTGEPVFLAGSLVAADAYGMGNLAYHDVDLFCPTSQVLISVGQRLLDSGYTFDDRFDRVWARWLRYGFKTWHTNSLRLRSPSGVETNLVYKLADGHPTTSLGQVLESFDFGLLAVGYDLEEDLFRDMRGYLFPGLNPNGPLPMMPNKRSNWRNGFISQYNGLREAGRYAKYHNYGYDLSSVKDDLVTGYEAASSYLSTHFDADKQLLGRIYEAIGLHIEGDNILELTEAAKQINYTDALDTIMEALE
jgi:hypothetical protein